MCTERPPLVVYTQGSSFVERRIGGWPAPTEFGCGKVANFAAATAGVHTTLPISRSRCDLEGVHCAAPLAITCVS